MYFDENLIFIIGILKKLIRNFHVHRQTNMVKGSDVEAHFEGLSQSTSRILNTDCNEKEDPSTVRPLCAENYSQFVVCIFKTAVEIVR